MLAATFGLRTNPFTAIADPQWFYESPTHSEAIARMHYLVENQRNCGVLLGPSGSGKSMLLAEFERQIARTPRLVARVDLTGVAGQDLPVLLASRLGLPLPPHETVSGTWQRLFDLLAGNAAIGRQTVVLLDNIDRASASAELAVERLLNLPAAAAAWTTVIVAGRRGSGVSERIAEWSALRIELSPWEREDVERCLQTLTQRAGRDDTLFDETAVAAIQEASRGNPREVVRLCDLALVAAASGREPRVTRAAVTTAIQERQSPRQGYPLASAASGL